jgi:hypothetical protein
MATTTTESTATTTGTKEITPTESGASTLPQIILGRPHNMPRRLMNVGASRRETSGRE